MSDHTDIPRRMLARRAASAALRGGIALAIVGGVAGGVAALNTRAGNGIAGDKAAPLPVEAMTVERQAGHSEQRRYAGRTEPARETALAFERAGRVAALLVREGDAVAAGEVVARLDTALLANEQARLDSVRAEQAARLDLARLTASRA